MKRLETTILKNLIFNEDYARKILPFIKSEYFTDNTEKILFEEVEEYINHYKHLPTYESLVINFAESKKLTEQQVQDAATPEQAAPTLGVGDLAAMVQVIDVVSERGAFKGPELESIGHLRGRITRFIEANKAAEQAAAGTEATPAEAPTAAE